MKDKFIKVVVTDLLGNEAEDETLTKVGVDASFDVELVDDYGLQDDGTGIVGDKLTVTYGASFGVPTNVSWYKDGKVVATNTVGDNVNQGLTRTITAANWGTGVYKVTITNTDGDMAETNEITITDKEEPAEILDFTLEDDYTDGTDLTYSTRDQRVIATVTMSKNYSGRLRVYRANDTSFRTPLNNDSLTTSVDEPVATAAQAVNTASGMAGVVGWPGYPADQASVLTSNQATNFQVVNAGNAGNAASIGSGYGFINADGTVTYKWALNSTGVERGAEYVVAFDQASISTDTPGTGIANASAVAVAPYIEAPSSIAVTKVADGNRPEITFQDEAGEALGWMRATEATLAATGVATANIYSATTKTTDTTASGVNPIVAGVTNRAAADTVTKGVWKSAATADDTAFWFAKASLTKGIFGENAIDLTSEVVAVAQSVASDMTILEDKTTATSAVVDFSELRAPGTVYIVRGSYQTATTGAINVVTDNASSLAQIYGKFDPADASSYEASAKVEAGAAKVTIPNAIGSFTGLNMANVTGIGAGLAPASYWKDGVFTATATSTTYKTDDYIAVFVPDDDSNYGTIYTDGLVSADSYTKNKTTAAKTYLRLVQMPTSLTFNKNPGTGRIATTGATHLLTIDDTTTGTNASAGAFYANDQFGNRMRTAKTEQSATVEVVDKVIANTEKATATYDIGNQGDVTLNVTVGNVNTATFNVDKTDGFKVTVLDKVIEITNTVTNPIAVAADVAAAHNTATWTVKVGGDQLCGPLQATIDAGVAAENTADINTASAAVITTLNNLDLNATGGLSYVLPAASNGCTFTYTAQATVTAGNVVTAFDATTNTATVSESTGGLTASVIQLVITKGTGDQAGTQKIVNITFTDDNANTAKHVKVTAANPV